MGVGNFQFSRDETEREKQMEFFRTMQYETKTRRIKNEIYNLEREIELKQRLVKVKQRRFLKHGYTLEEIQKVQAISDYDLEIGEMDKEVKDLQTYADQTDLRTQTETVRTTSSNPEDFGFLKTMKRKIGLDREWDKPKLSWIFRKLRCAKCKTYMKFFFPLFIFCFSKAHNMRWKNLILVCDENASFSFMDPQSFFDLAILSIFSKNSSFSKHVFFVIKNQDKYHYIDNKMIFQKQ